MKFLGIAIIGIALFSANSATAFEVKPLSKELSRVQPRLQKISKQPKKALLVKGEDCEDFSGTWMGSCRSSDGTKDEDTLEIVQTECVSISTNGDDLDLSGLTTEVKSKFGGAPLGGSMTVFGRWDESGKFVSMVGSMLVAVDDTDIFVSGAARGKMWLQDGALHTTSKSKIDIEVAGNIEPIENATECTYSKK